MTLYFKLPGMCSRTIPNYAVFWGSGAVRQVLHDVTSACECWILCREWTSFVCAAASYRLSSHECELNLDFQGSGYNLHTGNGFDFCEII